MSRRRRRGISPTLFPFLAVLICTLGTLILLLALVAENATDAAEQRVAETTESDEPAGAAPLSAEAVASMIEAEKFRVEKLVAFRDSQTADLETRRDRLTHLEEHTRRLEQQLERISAEIQAASDTSDEDDTPKAADLVILREQLEAEKESLEELRESAGDQTPRVVIVPHEGPNGTERRPIYLECTADGVTVWPEGAKISDVQLQDTTPGANPLDAALRVIRHHTTHTYGDSLPPYPLLVVRPGGIESYAAARQAMQDWDDQFGYELVPGEVELAFQKPDPNLKPRIELAIREAVLKQETRQRIAGGGYGGRGYGGGALGGRRGTIGSGRRRMPTLSAAELDRRGRQSGFRQHEDDFGGAAAGYASTGGHGSPADYGGGATDSGAAAARRLDEHLRTAAEQQDQQVARGDAAGESGAQPGGATGEDAPDQAAGSASGRGGRGASEASAESLHAGSGMAGGDTSSSDTAAGDTAGSDTASGETLALTGPAGAGVQANPYTGSARTSEAPPGQQPPAGISGQGRADGGAETSGRGSRDRGTQRTGGDGPPAASAGGVAGGISPSGTRHPAANSEQESPSEQASASSSSSPSSGSSAARPDQELVRRQGRDWALPERVAGAEGNAVVRTIRLQCHGDRFVLHPGRGDRSVQVFGFDDGDVKKATLQLATAVRDRIRGWGAAIPGGRWQPRLEVEVMPRAETRFHQLRTWMNGSGVEIQRRRSP